MHSAYATFNKISVTSICVAVGFIGGRPQTTW